MACFRINFRHETNLLGGETARAGSQPASARVLR
jgi:hypothetical protein